MLHEVSDHLESFFYVFVWICVFFAGPDGVVQSRPKPDNSSILHTQGEGALASGGLTNTADAKAAFLYSAIDTIVDKQFSPYFSNMKSLAKRWKELVRNEDIRRARPNAPTGREHNK